jgi:alanine-glyoxylate transaminase / serine-glyoxylate transaminase / serine-pyruvate transaminase
VTSEQPTVPPWDERLFLPGPTPIPWPIAHAMARPMTELRGAGLAAIVERVEAGVARLFGTGRAVAVTGTGTATLETLTQNLFAPGDSVVAVVHGAFGNRFAQAAELHGLEVRRLDVAYGAVPEPERLADLLRQRPARGLLLVHNETSTGILTPVGDLARAARAVVPDILCLVDSISGVPSVPLNMDAIGVDAATAASQKGFMGPPGLGLIGLGPRALDAVKKERPGRMYFDLNALVARHFNSTPAISHWYAMDESLRLLDAEGDHARHARHVRMARMVRAAGRAIGMPPRAPDAFASPTVTPLAVPEPFTAQQVLRGVRAYGAALAGAMGPWAERTVRVGHLGAIAPLDMTMAIAALEAALLDLYGGVGQAAPFAPGAGVGEAVRVLRAAGDDA